MKRFSICISALLFSLAGMAQGVFERTDSLITVARYDDAMTLINRALSETNDKKTSVLLGNKAAEILITQGKLDEAEAQLKKIDTNGDPFLEAITKTNSGVLQLNRARNDLALQQLQRATQLFLQAGKQNTQESAKCLADLSLVYANTGKFNQARENGLVALQLRQKLFPENSEQVAGSYNDLGLVYEEQDPDQALAYYEKALAIYTRLLGARHPKIAQANSNIGFVYKKLKLYGDAINNFETAEEIIKETYPAGHPSQAFALVNLGLTNLQMNNSRAATEYLEKALAIYIRIYGSKHSDIASVYNQIGLIKLSENQYEDALRFFQSALCANVPDYNNTALSSNPRIDQFYNGKVLLYSLRLKAQAMEAMYYGKTLKADNLRAALLALHSCDTLIDNIRHHSTDERDKIELGESANETYEDGVRIAVAMSQMSVHSKQYGIEAFYFNEKSKSAVLQESIADAEAKSFAGIPQALVDQERDLKGQLTVLSQQLSQNTSSGEAALLRTKLFSVNQRYDVFIKTLETDYPNYYNLKFNSKLPRLDELQKQLDDKTGVVSYFISEKGKKIYQFVITSKKFRILSFALPDNFERSLSGFTKSILFSEINAYRKSVSVLSGVLVPRFAREITNIIIIPSGRLGTIPFEALPYKKFSTDDFKSIPYLLERFAISYEFSATLIGSKVTTQTTPKTPAIFLCAPVSFAESTRLNDLPATEKEVASIAALFGPAAASVVTGDDASEKLAKSGGLAKYNYLHFATHGVVDQVNPELSRIYLSEGANEDGSLFAGEIYGLDLNADLTVLSACQTGLGKVSKGEGVIGLSRALVYAGARNIVVSLWSVADESTSLLMTDFYRILMQSSEKNFRETLQKSKLSMLRKGTYSSPYYWAPFIMIGF